MNRLLRYFPLLLLVLLALAVWVSGAPRYMNMHVLRDHAAALRGLAHGRPNLSLAAFVMVLTAVTASCLPGGIPILMLASGFLFGTWIGGAASAAGISLGGALLFAAIRSSVGTAVLERGVPVDGRLRIALEGVRSGAFGYILSLRLIPFVPFEVVSIAAALARIPFRPYLLGTALGVMPAAFIYSGLGVGIGQLIARGGTPHLRVLLTPALVIPLLALSVLSLATTLFVHRRAGSKAAFPAD